MLTKIKIPDIVTILNAFCGLTAIFLSFFGFTPLIPILILIAVIFDGLDGYLARKLGSSELGEILDSLADIISFGVAPAVILFSIYPASPLLIMGLYLFISCGILRLARFGISKKSNFFEGLPITAGAIIITSFTLIDIYHSYVEIIGLLTIILALFMISSIPFPKIKNTKIIILTLIIFGLTVIGNLANIYALIISFVFFLVLILYLGYSLFIYLNPVKNNKF